MQPDGPKRSGWGRTLVALHRQQLNLYLAARPELKRLRLSLHTLLNGLLSHCSAENILADGRAVCWVGLGTIATTYGMQGRSVRRLLRKLEASGVVQVLYGAGVSKAVHPEQGRHGGSFVRRDGLVVTTGNMSHQFVFAVPVSADVANDQPAAAADAAPRRRSAPLPRESSSRVPRLPDDKRAEIEDVIGLADCRRFIAEVSAEWSDRPPEPPRMYDFWNARLAEWQARGLSRQASDVANLEAERTHRNAHELREAVKQSMDSPERAAIVADIRARLAQFPATGAGRV